MKKFNLYIIETEHGIRFDALSLPLEDIGKDITMTAIYDEKIEVIEFTPEVKRAVENYQPLIDELRISFHRFKPQHNKLCAQVIDSDNDCSCGESEHFDRIKQLLKGCE